MNETFIESTFMFFLENWLDILIVLSFILLFISIAYIKNVESTHGKETGFEEKKMETIFHRSLFLKEPDVAEKNKSESLEGDETAVLAEPVPEPSKKGKLFNVLDLNSDEHLTKSEVQRAFDGLNISDDNISEIFDKRDRNSDGIMTRMEYTEGFSVNEYPYKDKISDHDLFYYKN